MRNYHYGFPRTSKCNENGPLVGQKRPLLFYSLTIFIIRLSCGEGNTEYHC